MLGVFRQFVPDWFAGRTSLSGSGLKIQAFLKETTVKALGEVALRVNNLERMKRFYQEVLGFEVLGEFPNAALLKIAAGYAGHLGC